MNKILESEPWVIKALEGPIPEGQRDDTCTRLAGHYLNILPQATVEQILINWGLSHCDPPFPKEDVLKCVNSIAQKRRRESPELNILTGRESLERELIEIPELIANCVRVGDLTLLVGFGGIGKSSIALNMALCLAGGKGFLDFEVPQPEKVLYLDLEMGEYEFRTRLNTLLPVFGESAKDNFFWVSIPNQEIRGFKINNSADKDKLWNALARFSPKLLVVDNHGRFHSGDANKESDMLPMVVTPLGEAMAQFNLGILYLMHTPLSERDRPRGTVCILDAASTAISIEKPTGYPRGRILKWIKNRSVKRGRMPTEASIYYDPKTLLISEKEKSIWLPDQVDFPMERARLMEFFQDQFGMSKTSAHNKVTEYEETGRLIRKGHMVDLGEKPTEPVRDED